MGPSGGVRRVAVVLAAGEGRRFGAVKQLAPLRGRPLLRHVLDAMVSRADVAETVVVLGAHVDTIRGALDLTDATVVVCDDWAHGPSASLATGLAAAVRSGAGEVLIVLGDQPMLPAVTVDRVLAGPGDVVRAVHGRRPGHPVLLRGDAIAHVAGLGDADRKTYFAAAARPVPVGDVDPGPDVDRPEDLLALEGGAGPSGA